MRHSRQVRPGRPRRSWQRAGALWAGRPWRWSAPGGAASPRHQVSGFATGAKQSMSATLIPRALARGARLLANCRVDRLVVEGRRVSGAIATASDANGRRHRVTVNASQVFLCAGTIQTPSILLRSGIRKNIGRAFQVHPTIRVLATFPEAVNAHRHELPLAAITEFMPALRFGGSVFTLSTFGLALAEDWPVRGRYLPEYAHCAMYYAMIRPDGVGRVRTVRGLAEPILSLCPDRARLAAPARWPGVAGARAAGRRRDPRHPLDAATPAGPMPAGSGGPALWAASGPRRADDDPSVRELPHGPRSGMLFRSIHGAAWRASTMSSWRTAACCPAPRREPADHHGIGVPCYRLLSGGPPLGPGVGEDMVAAILELLRIRQWVKNGFVVAPLFFGYELDNVAAVTRGAIIFVVRLLPGVERCLYLQRLARHRGRPQACGKKARRPLPSGRVPVPLALTMMAALIVAAAAIIYFTHLPVGFAETVAIYLAINVAYSLMDQARLHRRAVLCGVGLRAASGRRLLTPFKSIYRPGSSSPRNAGAADSRGQAARRYRSGEP